MTTKHLRDALRKAALQKERIDLEADSEGVVFSVGAQNSAIFARLFVSCSHRKMAAMVGAWFVHLPKEEQRALIASMQAILDKQEEETDGHDLPDLVGGNPT